MSLPAGSLNRRITIQQREIGYDEAGQPTSNWVDVVTLWANIAGQNGMRSITQMQDSIPASIERYSFRIRYREGITAGMRVLHNGQAFDIRQVRMDFAGREYTDLVVELGGNDG